MRSAAIGLVILLFPTPSTWAASNVSPKFDGKYHGSVSPTPGMSRPECTPFQADLSATAGLIHRDAKVAVSFDGFITEEGFVHGHLRRPGQAPVLMEGRITDTSLNAGAIDDATGCAWVLNLERSP